MLVIGVVGGIASGKSFVAQAFAELGAAVLDADLVGHQVLLRAEVREAIRSAWGDAVFRSDGHVDRGQLAAIVFRSTPESRVQLERLESITHPRIEEELNRQLQALRAARRPAVVLDAAVMFKAGWHRLCDKIVYVEAPETVRIARAAARGWSAEQWREREARQTPLAEKRRWADVVIDNSGSADATRAEVLRCWQSWFGNESAAARRTSHE